MSNAFSMLSGASLATAIISTSTVEPGWGFLFALAAGLALLAWAAETTAHS